MADCLHTSWQPETMEVMQIYDLRLCCLALTRVVDLLQTQMCTAGTTFTRQAAKAQYVERSNFDTLEGK